MRVPLQNKATGEVRLIKVGWSWTCFFFSGWLGIPLFLRRLNVWGAVMVILFVLNIALNVLEGLNISDMVTLQVFIAQITLGIVGIVLIIYLALNANELAGKLLLENGWIFAKPIGPETAAARQKWGLPDVLIQPDPNR